MGKRGSLFSVLSIWALMFAAPLGYTAPARAESAPALTGLTERYSPSVDVSGEVVVGAIATSAGVADPGRITVYGLNPADRLLCLDVASQDGRYRATASISLRSASGVMTFDYPTKYARELRAIGVEQLAPLARAVSAGEACQSARGEVLVASWGGPSPITEFSIIANSLQARVNGRVEFSGGASSAAAECRRVSGVAVAFDTVCAVQPSIGSCGAAEVVLNRRQGVMRFVDRAPMRLLCR